MGAQIQYVLSLLTVNGAIGLQVSHIQVSRTTASQPGKTLALGYAGESPGAAMCEVKVTALVPAGGFEFQAGAQMAGLIPAKVFVLGPGGQTLKSTGQITGDDYSQAVDALASYTFTMRAPYVDWANSSGV